MILGHSGATEHHPIGVMPRHLLRGDACVMEARTLPRLLTAPLQVGRAWIERIVAMQGIDRAVVLGAQAFTALFPALIVYASLVSPGGEEGFAERLIDRLNISGPSAETLRRAFTPPESDTGVTVLSAALVMISALAFARAMQRLYEHAWNVEPRGMRTTGWGVVWLAGLLAFVSLRGLADNELVGIGDIIVSLALSTLLWLATPFVLLARRVSWQRLLPGAALTALAMLAYSLVMVAVAPHSFGSAADAYGLIGVAFAIVGWLVAAAFVVMASTALAAVIAQEPRDA